MLTIPEPKVIAAVGDTHGQGSWLQKAIWYGKKQGADTFVHVGDFGLWRPCHDTDKFLKVVHRTLVETDTYLVWVDGNHEDHSRIAHNGMIDTSEFKGKNFWAHANKWSDRIIYAPRGSRWEWSGKTWMGLGGAHSVDRKWRTPLLDWWPQESLTRYDFDEAIKGGKVDVVLAHDCPNGVAIPGINDDDPNGWPQEDIYASQVHRELVGEICDLTKPDLWINGHYHVRHSGLRNAKDGWKTQIEILDRDHTTLAGNVILLDPATLEILPPKE